jgi:hypothetical protein
MADTPRDTRTELSGKRTQDRMLRTRPVLTAR